MGDFKCNSGINSDNKQDNYNNENDFSGRDNSAAGAAASGLAADAASKYTRSGSESEYENELPENRTSQYTRSKSEDNNYDPKSDINSGSGCGCGSSNDDLEASGYNNDLQSQDEDPSAIIYSETIIFTDPYAGVNDDEATSNLVSDEEEGSEYIAPDPNRPQC